MDFLKMGIKETKKGRELYPKFIINNKSSDLMIRGGDFYAVWLPDLGLWSTEEQDAINLIDSQLSTWKEELDAKTGDKVVTKYLWDAESGMIDIWHKYCQKQMRDTFHMLDEKLIFSNTETTKKDYASKRLPYPLEKGETTSYDRLMDVLYSPQEREKIEWAIGSVVNGDSKKLQKFLVLYGAAGTGKSTILNIIQQLFEGYYSVFDAKALGSSNNSFALESFKTNPLVAIQHDGDLSRIEDNTRLNSLVSHEMMTVNEKFKSTYSNRFKSFLFMGTNKPVKITDAKSGLIRRLIDVSPTGNKVNPKEYKSLTKQIEFELGAIAWHCKEVYESDPAKYDGYIPVTMLGASNDFYNFISDSYYVFKKEDGTTLKAAWEMYKTYCDDAKVNYPYSQRVFKEELKNYFNDYKDRYHTEDLDVRNYYIGFNAEKFENIDEFVEEKIHGIIFQEIKSIFDEECKDCYAQYANSDEVPSFSWNTIKTKKKTRLSDLDTHQLHYVQVPKNHIVIDFDLKDKDGNKCFDLNLTEASKWPATYAEVSKGGHGIHLHYIYTGDPEKLANLYSKDIEIKVFKGNSSLRRRLSLCNDLPIATISSGLPLKGEKKMVNFDKIKSEKGLRVMIKKNLCKEIHPGTKPSMDFIKKILDDAYESGINYDVSDMRNAILAFGANSTHQPDYCIKLVGVMKFKSDDISETIENDKAPIVFYDVEVFPNLFLINYKTEGTTNVTRMINPTPTEVEQLMKNRLVGFNCRRYDNHMLYARLLGYSNEQLYNLSQRIVSGSKNCFFGEAYNVSYTDIYDFSSKKQSLKKFEIELGIHHQELGLPWDQPVPEDQWIKVAEYCDNDVLATEAVWNARQADFTARKILADVAGMSPNDTTNSLTTRIIFGSNRTPQDQFKYRDMGDVTKIKKHAKDMHGPKVIYDDYCVFDADGKPIFPGYKFDAGKSIYRGEEVGEGGYVYAEPGMYGNTPVDDIASMHPHSLTAEEAFGYEYTAKFKELMDARIAIKHKDFDAARQMLGGKLAKYLTDEESASDLAQALKIAINSVYGLTSASFDNPFRDPRNVDNIVAKRGALFMINLKHEVQARGFIVAHIKTDSIKIPDATPEILQFVYDYGKMYGYEFEHEATYDRICLVNNAVYIAKYSTVDECRSMYDYVPGDNFKHSGEWTATGTQFQVPYVFKTLFSKEELKFKDYCETKAVTSSLYLDMNENLPEDEHNYRFIGKVGQFCPIKPGCGGGLLMREKDGKYYAATGTKGYRWQEAEIVRTLSKIDDIDLTYFENQASEAINTICPYGNYEWFISNDPYVKPKYKDGKPVYPDGVPYN